jgi:hypothetical protein
MGWDATFPIHTVLPPGITFTSQIKPLQQSMCKEIFKRNFRPLEAREIPENWKEILLPYLEKFSTILYSHDLAYVLERKNNNHLNYTIELR